MTDQISAQLREGINPDCLVDMDAEILEDADHIDAQAAKIKALVDALTASVATIEDYIGYQHDGDPWSEDARAMGEMDINDYATDGRLENARAQLRTRA